ncbi:MAG: hypothetical protein LDL53_01745 [Candidatus Hydrogenedens sp.]|nr:hypothetical protein [Candidatus Hydrogenedens sp.]
MQYSCSLRHAFKVEGSRMTTVRTPTLLKLGSQRFQWSDGTRGIFLN